MRFARRVSSIVVSPTMVVMLEAQRLKKQGVDIIDFGPGEPDFPTPEPIKRAGVAAIESDFTKYTAGIGIDELRQAVADKFNREWAADFSAEHVAITAGAKSAIYNVCMTVFQEGDEVLIPVPYWVTFPEVVRLAGATPMLLAADEADGFLLDVSRVDAAAGPRTRGIIVNTPNNPTGAVLTDAAVERLVDLGRRRGLFLLFDETYEYFTYGSRRHVSLAASVRAAEEFYAIVGSFSKTYSMTGWRIGYIVAHRHLIDKVNEFQSHHSGNPVSISQKAALAALASTPDLVQAMREEYRLRRDFVVASVQTVPGFSCVCPDGAFYVFPNIKTCLNLSGMKDSREFAQFLVREARVATVPGSAFGLDGYLRLSYATSMGNLQEGLSRIRESVGGLLERREKHV